MIVAVSQVLIYMVYLHPLTSSNDELVLNGHLWLLFVIDTILIAAGGYVINDIMDIKVDSVNKPEDIFIGEKKISPQGGWIYYVALVLGGFVLALYIAITIDKIHLLFIYPLAVLLLYLYSSHFKRLPLLGNLVVGIFCAFVPGIIWYAEYDSINYYAGSANPQYELLMHLFPVYITFAFLSTMVREVIKDIEDLEGDAKYDFNTLPVVAGPERAKIIAFFFCIILLCTYFFWFTGFSTRADFIIAAIIVLGLMLPTAYILRKIHGARSTTDYSRISKLLKYLMIVSLFIFLCIPFI